MDLSGGIGAERDLVFAERPEDPEMRDSVSFWVFDDTGTVGLSRIGIEAVSANWEQHGVQANVGFPDGRLFRLRDDGPAWSSVGSDGQPTVLGAGPLGFRCVEPFRTWTMTFDGAATQTSSADLAEGRKDGPLVDLQFEVEATMAVPPWVQGTLDPESRTQLETSIEGDLMGGERWEQLFRARGRVRVGGDEQTFTGSGLRIKRQGVRKLAGFWGHCWQSALFPSGRAFGYIAYPPRPDGEPTFNEGYVYGGDGELVPARVAQAPWLNRLKPAGDDVSLVLETAEADVRIQGETAFSSFDIHHNDDTSAIRALKEEIPDFPALHQGGARYTWDGEETYGMVERSIPMDKIQRD